MGLKLGLLMLDSKTHKKSSKGDKWTLVFKDDAGCSLTFKNADESDFEEYEYVDTLEWNKVLRQTNLG